MNDYRLGDLLDMSMLQKLADSNYSASGLPMTIVDAIDLTVLIKAGWPEICDRFHRVHPVSLQRCHVSDRYVSDQLGEAEVLQYKCQNGLWHIAIPIAVGNRHLATLFLTQFFFEGEQPDHDYFTRQALELGYDLDCYLAALDAMPFFSHEKVDYIRVYYTALMRFIADLAEQSIRVIETNRSLLTSREELQKAHDELEARVVERTAALLKTNEMLLVEIRERERIEQKLRDLSERDPLTAIYNRRKLFELLGFEIDKAQRYNRPLSLLMFDLDHFKQVNDTFGHNIGDAVLKASVNVVSGIIRKTDLFARYGGEEFIIAMPESALPGASMMAEKIRIAIEQYRFPIAGRITVSIGLAELSATETDADLIKRADESLYAAKRAGRNRVIAAPAS